MFLSLPVVGVQGVDYIPQKALVHGGVPQRQRIDAGVKVVLNKKGAALQCGSSVKKRSGVARIRKSQTHEIPTRKDED